MAKYTIQLVEDAPWGTYRVGYYFGHQGGNNSSVIMIQAPWEIEASCFYDAVVKMWHDRLTEDGDLPNALRFVPEHHLNSDQVRMWRWGSNEVIKVQRVSP